MRAFAVWWPLPKPLSLVTSALLENGVAAQFGLTSRFPRVAVSRALSHLNPTSSGLCCSMKNMSRGLLLCSFLLLLAASVQARVGGMDVTVSDSAGRLAYRGQTDADGTFSTGRIAPGKYVVQLNARDASVRDGEYAIVVGAGRHKVVADSVAGEKFVRGGVAMRVKAPGGTRISGQVAEGASAVLGRRIVDGRRYVLTVGLIGTNLGPRWVEEGTPAPYNIVRYSYDSVRDLQDRGAGMPRRR